MFFAMKPSESWPGLRSRYLTFGFVFNFLLLSLAHFLEPQIPYQVCTQGFSFLTERSICLSSREGSGWSPLGFQLFGSVPSNRYLCRREKPVRTVVGGDPGSRQPQKLSAGQAHFQQPCPQVLPARGVFPC